MVLGRHCATHSLCFTETYLNSWTSGSRGGATISRVGVQILLRAKRVENCLGCAPTYASLGVQQLQREAYGEPIGQHCYNILLVVLHIPKNDNSEVGTMFYYHHKNRLLSYDNNLLTE